MSVSEAKSSVSNSIENTNKPEDIEDSECMFADSACGEPLVTQRVSLDFTPNVLDNDFVQRKCCAFWEYINSRPELKDIKVVPAKSSVSNSIENTNKPEDIEDSECMFADSACGEPLVTQRVSLDFTPNVLDNDFVQRKCCAFWEYINSRPELKDIKVVPDTEVYTNKTKSSFVQPNILPQRQTSSHNITKTAVDMLVFVEEKGLIDRAFEAKLPKSYCENNRMPSSNVSMTGISKGHQLYDNKDLKNKKEKRQTNMKALPKLRVMCNKMDEWDMNHPKSMKPPRPPPALPDDIKLIRY